MTTGQAPGAVDDFWPVKCWQLRENGTSQDVAAVGAFVAEDCGCAS